MTAPGAEVVARWRSVLFVPAHVDRFVATAHQREADAVQLDLEDGVAADAKAVARAALGPAVDRLAGRGVELAVRVNRELGECVRDLEAAVRPGVSVITLPKVLGPEHVTLVAEQIGRLERERGMPSGRIGLVAMVETVQALQRVEAIATAGGRLVGLALGSEDLATDAGFEPTPENLREPCRRMLLAARAGGIVPFGFPRSIGEFRDLAALRDALREARGMGFRGAFCIHPAQVAILNDAFSPTAEELIWARGVLEAFLVAGAGLGAVAHAGQMVDRPVVERARSILHGECRAAGRSG